MKTLYHIYKNSFRDLSAFMRFSMGFIVGIVLLETLFFAKGVISDASTPTVVVVISSTILQNNINLPQIFQKMQGYPVGINQTSLVQFKTVTSQNETDTVEQVCDHLASGVFAVVDMSTPRLAPLLKSACETFGIAYISMVDSSYFNYPLQRADNDVMIDPAATQMLMVVGDIVLNTSLNNVAIVHDDTFDIQNTPRRILTNIPAQHMYMKISNNETETRNRVTTIIKISIKAIFVIADNTRSEHFLSLLYDNNATNFDPYVFVLTKDSTFSCASCPGNHKILLIRAQTNSVGIASFNNFMRGALPSADYNPASVKIDEALAFDVARLVVNAVSNMTTSRGGLHNVAHLDCYNVSTVNDSSVEQSHQLAEAMSQTVVAGVYGLLSWDRKENTIRYSMTLLMNNIMLENGVQKGDVPVASWTKDSRITMIASTLITKEAKKNYSVVAAYAEFKPFVYKTVHPNGTAVYYGYCVELLELISNILDFEYTIYDKDDIGTMDNNGEWSGVIGELVSGRADIAIGPISVMAERENVIDFTVPYYDLVGLTILMRKPKVDYSLVKFLSVLDENVWGCIIGAFFLFSVLITVFDKLSPFSYQNRRAQWKETGPEPKIFTLKEGIWFCMMSLTPQGGGETPKALSGRLIAATWWLFGFIIIATYTANLAAFLTVSRLETPVESLEDLSKQSKIKYAPMNGSTAMLYFKRMADIELRFYEIWKDMSLKDNLSAAERAKLAVWDYPVSDKYTKLWETMNKTNFPVNRAEAVKRVLNEDFAFISDATTNKYQTIINCDLMVVGDEFSRKPYALAVQEGSPLRGQISTAILTLINNRSLEELKTRWWARDKKDCPTVADESDGISIHNIGGVFLVIVIGSGLSLITLAFECYWYRYRPERRRKALANAAGRPQLTSSVTSPKDSKSSESNSKHESDRSGLANHVGLDAGFTFSEFELNDNGVLGRGNTGFEDTERF